MIWNKTTNLERINALSENTAVAHNGIVFTEIGDDYLVAEMPVDHRTVQPMRMLHGGVSCILAETLGSVAGMLAVPIPGKDYVVGTEINASHVRGAQEGSKVIGKVTPIKIGRTVQVWSIAITNEEGKLVCSSRLSCQVMKG